MRILGQIQTFNDIEVIERAIDALRQQTRPPDGIVVVDNDSKDGTVEIISSQPVTIIRNSANLGTSGAVCVGFKYALEHGFDLVWILDADSVPQSDALEKLLLAFRQLPLSAQEQTCFLACRVPGAHPPMIFSASGDPLTAAAGCGIVRCDCALWSGSLYRMAAVEAIGLPDANYVLDWGELEYGYRAWMRGYSSYVVDDGIVQQDVGRPPGIAIHAWRMGPLEFRFFNASPHRCYYFIRNAIYFWLHQCRPRRARRMVRMMLTCLGFTAGFFVRPMSQRPQLVACLRGIRDGLTGQIKRRY
jgi:rhamnopyranosyl-N-acetylglucosaminyl-diphospho-decaprenol beta-1,3/1,4-galactofuranosyltransferase